ncbi:MAG: amidohydrolase [Betaproteobacteria bacterium]|nr:amidohydrolase [Betaproteobacteria bacterium]
MTTKGPAFHRIDTHHHIFPPKWMAAAGERIMESAIGIPRSWMFDWTPEVSLEAMDKHGIGVTIGSVSTPGVSFGDALAARKLARECNDYGAKMVSDHPTRFGVFATVPMPDVEGTLREIEYSLDVLKLDGICFMTNFGDTWPGDPQFKEVFDELNRRKAVVFFHPHLLASAPIFVPNVPPAVLEYPFDSTRAIASLLYAGTFTRCRDMKWIFSHGGGALPFLAGRLAALSRRPTEEAKRLADMLPEGPEYELKRLYYDTPSATNRPAIAALLSLVPVTQVLFGTDFPYLRAERGTNGFDALGFDVADHAAISRRNAVALMPRLAKFVAA